MSASVILSILALYTCGLLFILTGVQALKKFKNTPSERCFGYSILLMGVILGPLMGTRTIFGIYGYHLIDFAISVFDQLPLIISLTALGMYFSHKIFGIDKRKIIKFSFLIVGAFFLFLLVYALFIQSYSGPHISKWGTEYKPTGLPRMGFVFIWILLTALNLIFLAQRAWKRKTGKREKLGLDFYVGIIMLFFLTTFIFEELGEMTTWKLVFSRVSVNAAAVALYLIYTKESLKEGSI